MQHLLETFLSLCSAQGPEQLLQAGTDAVAAPRAGRGSCQAAGQTSCLASHTLVNSVIFSKTNHLMDSFLPPWGGGKGLFLQSTSGKPYCYPLVISDGFYLEACTKKRELDTRVSPVWSG